MLVCDSNVFWCNIHTCIRFSLRCLHTVYLECSKASKQASISQSLTQQSVCSSVWPVSWLVGQSVSGWVSWSVSQLVSHLTVSLSIRPSASQPVGQLVSGWVGESVRKQSVCPSIHWPVSRRGCLVGWSVGQ